MTGSHRLDWHARPSPISQAVARRTQPYLDLTVSNPTTAGLHYPAFTIDGLQPYVPDPLGLRAAREAIASWSGARVDNLLLTASTSEAYAFLFKLLCDPGDEVLIPQPSYPLFEFLAGLEGVRTRTYPLFFDQGWFVDAAALASRVTPRTRAIVIVNPNNPTGSFLRRRELRQMEQLGLPLISDEVFADYAYGPDDLRVVNVAREAEVLAFSLNGLSKSCGLPQVKLGWIECGGPGREAARLRLEWIADTYLSVSTPVQHAAGQWLAVGADVRQQIQRRVAQNRTVVPEALPADGGWYAILRLPAVRTELEWTLLLLEEHDVLIQPGFFFDFSSEAYAVISLLTETDTFREGVRRIRAAVAASLTS